MSHPLIPIGVLMTQSWHQFVKNWNQTLRISAWFLVAPVLLFLVAIISPSAPHLNAGIFSLFFLVYGILNTWIMIRLLMWILPNDQGKIADPKEARVAWSFFFPMIWISILMSLAVLGGLILFVIPGIWLAISLMFSRFFLIEDNLHGVQSLAASRALVKGRWWPVLWRLVVPGILFFLLYSVLTNLLSGVSGLIAGTAKTNLVFSMYGPTSQEPVAIGSWYLIQGIGQMLLTPLAIIWAVKLFHSLKDSR